MKKALEEYGRYIKNNGGKAGGATYREGQEEVCRFREMGSCPWCSIISTRASG